MRPTHSRRPGWQRSRALIAGLLLLGCTRASVGQVAPEPGERHLRNIRQLTFGGNNAEAYFSPSGKQLIFQRQAPGAGCDQQYLMLGGMAPTSTGSPTTTPTTPRPRFRRMAAGWCLPAPAMATSSFTP